MSSTQQVGSRPGRISTEFGSYLRPHTECVIISPRGRRRQAVRRLAPADVESPVAPAASGSSGRSRSYRRRWLEYNDLASADPVTHPSMRPGRSTTVAENLLWSTHRTEDLSCSTLRVISRAQSGCCPAVLTAGATGIVPALRKGYTCLVTTTRARPQAHTTDDLQEQKRLTRRSVLRGAAGVGAAGIAATALAGPPARLCRRGARPAAPATRSATAGEADADPSGAVHRACARRQVRRDRCVPRRQPCPRARPGTGRPARCGRAADDRPCALPFSSTIL